MKGSLALSIDLVRLILARSSGLRATLSASLAEDIVGVGLAGASPLLLKSIIDQLTAGARLDAKLCADTTIFALSLAAPNLLAAQKLVHATLIGERLQQRLTQNLVRDRLTSFGPQADASASLALIERLPSALQMVLDVVAWRAAPLVFQTTASLAALAFALPPIIVVVIATTMLAYVIVALAGAEAYQQGVAVLHASSLRSSTTLGDLLHNEERAILNGAANHELDRLAASAETRLTAAVDAAKSLRIGIAGQSFVLTLGLGAILALCIIAVGRHQLGVSGFVTAQAFAFRLILPLGGMVVGVRQAGPALKTLEAFRGVMTPNDHAALANATPVLESAPSGVEVRAVSFQYGMDGAALHEIEFELAPGTLTALVGANGVGKSTLAKLVAGRLNPNRGRIWVDGNDLASLDNAELTRLVLYCPQHFRLFDRGLAETVLYPPTDLTSGELVNGLARLQFTTDSVTRGPHETIGPDGARLSGGQRQKLELIRLSGTHARLLVLDEATSALDADSERRALDLLRIQLPSTAILMVTHRVSVAKSADQVLYLSQGRIAGGATHSALAHNNQSYRQLWGLSDDAT